ncbi:MAG TPA: hypothetical protein VKS24_24915 [Bradyrhizobium sp.]|nr:hypothetical protein [Bradyrhizobium sp.]
MALMASSDPTLDDRLYELIAAGKTSAECAAILGITRNAAMGRARRRGFKWHTPPLAQRWRYPRTLEDRLDAIHTKFDATIAEIRKRAEKFPLTYRAQL